MEDRWFGNAFQKFEATDENDLEAAMVILCGGTHIDKDEEDRSLFSCHAFGVSSLRIGIVSHFSSLIQP